MLLAVSACGDDGGGDGGDDGPDVNSCSTAELAIDSVPGTVSGSYKGKGSDISVAEGACASETSYFAPDGEDNVVSLSGLTVGQMYGVTVTSDDDISIYITSACPEGGEATGCVAFIDLGATGDGESLVFTATATQHFLVVDYSTEWNEPADVAGDFTAEIFAAQCDPNSDTSTCALPTPACGPDFQCHECGSPFDCSGAEPVCSDTLECVAGPALCVGDDARDDGNGDDGPNNAFEIAPPTEMTPTVVAGKICSTDDFEIDWYKVTLAAESSISFNLDVPMGADLDMFVFTASGQRVDAGQNNTGIDEAVLVEDLPAGTYLIAIKQFVEQGMSASTTTVDYTLSLLVPECSPNEFASCTEANASVCSDAGVCEDGPAECTSGEDAGDPNDDGPAGARTLNAGTLSGGICTVPRNGEVDFYKFTATAAQNITITVDWTDAMQDIDLVILDASGKRYGESLYVKPEVVTLTNLPAGDYYAAITHFQAQAPMTPDLAAKAYTITRANNGTGTCTTSADCAAEYETQLYRSTCTTATGVCSFSTATSGALGAACDSNANCGMDGLCSYIPYESDAQKSVCVPPDGCEMTSDCTAAGANLTCTSGFVVNTIFGPFPADFCVPACASDLECGANQAEDPDDNAALPWIYYTCDNPGAAGVCTMAP